MSHREQRPYRTERRPLLSVCTILILSGFLLGLTTGRGISDEMQLPVLAAGMVGVLAFIGLDQVAAQRRLREEMKEQELIENRLNRHVSRCELIREPGDSAEIRIPQRNRADVAAEHSYSATVGSV